MKKVLITGITGFAGSHLAEKMVSSGKFKVFGTHISDRHLDNLSAIKENVTLRKVNLLDIELTARTIKEISPDIIYHLAASTNVAESYKKPSEVITNNTASQINVFEGVIRNDIKTEKIIIVSSCHIYGLVSPEDLPLTENTPFKPDNPYSVSKIAQDYLGLSYFLSYNLPIVRIRPGNHTGPRHSPEISVSRFAKAIAEIEKGLTEPVLTVGNLDTKRDFTDVRDVVRGYMLSAEKCKVGEAYNIGSGIAYQMQDILDRLLSLSTVKIKVISDRSLFRPSDIPEMRIDASKFMQITGWKPEIPFEQTLRDTLDYWRKVI